MQISGKHFSLITALLFLVTMTYIPSLFAETDEVRKVASVEVSGNRYVESAAILANVRSKAGDSFSKKQISRDVRALFATGYFEDVYVEGFPEAEGTRLVYVVKENPLIASIEILGNDEIPDKDLKPKLDMKPGRVFSASKLRKDRNTVRKAYLKKGFYQVNVTAVKKDRADGRIDLSLNISEGEVTHIRSINFIGNNAFSDAVLRDEIASRESNFGSWFSDRDVFDKERFGGDGQMLQQYYLNHGFLDMKVESAQLSLTPDKKNFYLTFSLYEGPQYYIDKINLQGDMVPSHDVLQEAITMEKGDIYTVTELRNSIKAIEEKVGDEGYAFVSATPLFKRDIESKLVSITFDVEKGQQVYVERIEISGNEKTTDKVVRRELRQYEGERYKSTGVARSKERLGRTRLFKDVRVNLEKTEKLDRVKMHVDVDDDTTGSFSVGLGYSQLEKGFLTGKVEERNFLGRGLVTNAQADIGGSTQNFTGNFADPYFLDSDIGASLNIYKTQTKLTDVTSYDQNSIGVGVNFVLPLTEFISYSLGYRYDQSNISNIDPGTSIALLSQAGKNATGEIATSISWDTRNNGFAPTEGHVETLGVKFAGLGGDNKFYELSVSTESYFALGADFVLRPKLGFDSISGFAGRDIPIYRRYSLGGVGSLRGFDSFGVSLRDPATGEAIGGDKQFKASIDLFFPLPYMKTSGFRGVLFLDAGTTWGAINTSLGAKTLNVSEKFTVSNIRTSTGVGIEWMSPVGPLSLAWSFPIHKVQGDLERNFEFALGASF